MLEAKKQRIGAQSVSQANDTLLLRFGSTLRAIKSKALSAQKRQALWGRSAGLERELRDFSRHCRGVK